MDVQQIMKMLIEIKPDRKADQEKEEADRENLKRMMNTTKEIRAGQEHIQ
jgi:hypothetical protein